MNYELKLTRLPKRPRMAPVMTLATKATVCSIKVSTTRNSKISSLYDENKRG